jgi:hypothetical protein
MQPPFYNMARVTLRCYSPVDSLATGAILIPGFTLALSKSSSNPSHCADRVRISGGFLRLSLQHAPGGE